MIAFIVKIAVMRLMTRIYLEVSTHPQLKSQMKLSTSHTLLQKNKTKKNLYDCSKDTVRLFS